MLSSWKMETQEITKWCKKINVYTVALWYSTFGENPFLLSAEHWANFFTHCLNIDINLNINLCFAQIWSMNMMHGFIYLPVSVSQQPPLVLPGNCLIAVVFPFIYIYPVEEV